MIRLEHDDDANTIVEKVNKVLETVGYRFTDDGLTQCWIERPSASTLTVSFMDCPSRSDCV